MKGIRRPRKDRDKNPDAHSALAAGLTAGATVFVFGALGGAMVLGIPRLESRLARGAREPARVEFAWPRMTAKGQPAEATWLPAVVQRDLQNAAQRELDADPDPLKPSALRRIAEAAAGSGWFEQITAVRREAGGVVRVEGEWRDRK